MKLTTRSSYGIRALINMAAANGGTRPVSLKDISEEEGISCEYLEQIFNRLRRAGVVKSVRGPKGGYVLARAAEDVTMLDVVSAVESGRREDKCFCGKVACDRTAICASRDVWEAVARQEKEVLERFSLGQLAERSGEKKTHIGSSVA